jgi:Ca-activated chloride channel family protein
MTIRVFLVLTSLLLLALALAGSPAVQIGGRGGAPGGRVLEPQVVTPTQPPPISDPDMVLLTVSVTGAQNAAVTGIDKSRFEVLEDGVEQELRYFWEDSRPITVGFVFDASARMDVNDKVYVLRDAGSSFLKNKNANDEYFVVRLSDFADVAVSFTTDPMMLPKAFPAVGETALYDGIHVALDVIKEAANPRKVVLVITSGGDRCCSDNNKTTTEDKLKEFAIRQPVQIYPVFIVDMIEDAEAEFIHRDGIVLEDLARMTGGRMYSAPNAARGVEAICAEIARGLKTQYLVGYKSTNAAKDGKRRGVRVKVNSPEGSPKLNVWTKAGYYAPKARG